MKDFHEITVMSYNRKSVQQNVAELHLWTNKLTTFFAPFNLIAIVKRELLLRIVIVKSL